MKQLIVMLFIFASSFSMSAVSADFSTQNVSYHNSAVGAQIAKNALNQIGVPYVYGGTSPRGFDCSGLVQYTHRLAGINTPRNSITLLRAIKPIPVSDLQAGDLIFYLIKQSKVTHVGIYVGNGRFVHAPRPGKNVKTENLRNPFWHNRIVSAGRLY